MIPVQKRPSEPQDAMLPQKEFQTTLVQTINVELRWGPKRVPMFGRNKNYRKYAYINFHLQASHDSLPLLSTYWCHKSTSLLWIWAPLRAVFIHSLPIKNRNGLAEDVKDSSTTDTVQAPFLSQAQTVTHKMRHSRPSCVFMNFKLW